MYLNHFGLKRPPFDSAPNPAFFYGGHARGEMLAALLYAVTRGEGIVKVTGEAGSGKTILCRMLETQLAPQASVIYLANPELGPQEVSYAIASSLGLDPDGKRSDEVLRLVHDRLAAMHGAGRRAVLLLEEVQAMSLETLEEIRLLTNLETTHHKLLQIVLFGQPALNDKLRQPRLRQLRERISYSFVLADMTADAIAELLACRLRAAGHDGAPLFAPDAVRLIGRASGGIALRIVTLADRALQAAFKAGANTVSARHVRGALKNGEFGFAWRIMARPVAVAATLLAVLGLGALALPLMRPTAKPVVPTSPIKPKPVPLPSSIVPAAQAEAVSTTTPTARQEEPAAAPAALVTTAASVKMGAAAAQAASVAMEAIPAAPAPAPAPPGTSASAVAKPAIIPSPSAVTTSASVATPATPTAAPAAPVVQSAPTPKPSMSLLQQSLRASKTWLRDEPAHHLSLQIESFPADRRDRAEKFLQEIREAIGLRDVHTYPVRVKGVARIAVIYGSFRTQAQAQHMQALLAKRWAYRPKIRAIKTIRDDVANSDNPKKTKQK
ncbi:MAG: AAA family ATPase [Pseudomonadota bacterium]